MMKAYNPRKNWIDELIESKAYPYPWDNARMEWMPDTNVWVLKFDIYKPKTEDMTTQQQETKSHWAIDLRKELFFSGSHFYNEFVRNITADLEGLAPACASAKERASVHSTLLQLGNHVAQLEGQHGNHLHRMNAGNGMKSCSVNEVKSPNPTPFKDALNEFEKKAGFDKARKLDTLKTAGDIILHHADNALIRDDRQMLTKLLIDIYKEVEKD